MLVSTPGTFVRSGWPPRRDRGCLERGQLRGIEEAGLRERHVERRRGVALAEHEPVPIGISPGVSGRCAGRRSRAWSGCRWRRTPRRCGPTRLVDHAQVAQPDARRTTAQLLDLAGRGVHAHTVGPGWVACGRLRVSGRHRTRSPCSSMLNRYSDSHVESTLYGGVVWVSSRLRRPCHRPATMSGIERPATLSRSLAWNRPKIRSTTLRSATASMS